MAHVCVVVVLAFWATPRVQLEQYPALVKLEQATHVPKSWGTLATIFVLSTAIFFNIFASFFTNILGFGLPAYLSLRALESPAKDDDVQWYVYLCISVAAASGEKREAIFGSCTHLSIFLLFFFLMETGSRTGSRSAT